MAQLICTCFVANLGSREYKRSSQLEAHDASSDSTKVFSALNWLCGNWYAKVRCNDFT